MEYFAVLDIETTWDNEVMSIGVVIGEKETFNPVAMQYYVISPTYRKGGMYSDMLNTRGKDTILCKKKEAIFGIKVLFDRHKITSVFAYNATFDYKHLKELENYTWYDIMSIAAYRQYNLAIPATAECCKTGRLKSNYGVQAIMCMLTKNRTYYETHNALYDALDELKIMKLLNVKIEMYFPLQKNHP